jgi:hypothetical protein
MSFYGRNGDDDIKIWPCFERGCQMVYFQTKNPILGKFWRVLQWKMLVYFVAIWSILRPFGILYDHLAYFSPFPYIFPYFGILHPEKSGNPGFEYHLHKGRLTSAGVDIVKTFRPK